MSIDKFGRHVFIKKLPTSRLLMYIRGKGEGSQIYQTPLFTFALENNKTVYTVPVEGTIDNVVYFPPKIFNHHNKSGQRDMKTLIGKRISRGDTFVFISSQKYDKDILYIELTIKI